jgi:WD40 repeat protein
MSDTIEDDQIAPDEGEDIFIQAGEAVEVEVNDEDVPMDDDDEEDASTSDVNVTSSGIEALADMSIQTINSHNNSSIYSIASHYDQAANCLSIITGGGDDKAFLHKLDNNNTLGSVQLPHAHTDSVSSVATNEKYVSADLKKTPKYIAVGAYDGSIILYNPENGEKINVLDGPTDVEFVSFHPKGGSVSVVLYMTLVFNFCYMTYNNLIFKMLCRYRFCLLDQLLMELFGCTICQVQNVFKYLWAMNVLAKAVG